LYSIAWRLQTARKPETRERRMKAILEMMAKGEKFH
jgi:Bacteriocin-protection, YdeI or OmpD-Associated